MNVQRLSRGERTPFLVFLVITIAAVYVIKILDYITLIFQTGTGTSIILPVYGIIIAIFKRLELIWTNGKRIVVVTMGEVLFQAVGMKQHVRVIAP